jgi:hypothetical protein
VLGAVLDPGIADEMAWSIVPDPARTEVVAARTIHSVKDSNPWTRVRPNSHFDPARCG